MGHRATLTIRDTAAEPVAVFYTHWDAAPERMLPLLGSILSQAATAPAILTALLTHPDAEIRDGKPAAAERLGPVVSLDLAPAAWADDLGDDMGMMEARYTVHTDGDRARVTVETHPGRYDGAPGPLAVVYDTAGKVYEAAAAAVIERAALERTLQNRPGGFPGLDPEWWDGLAVTLQAEAAIAGLRTPVTA
jgi:hypothetical protein